MSDDYPPLGATVGVMGVWTLGLGLLGDSESAIKNNDTRTQNEKCFYLTKDFYRPAILLFSFSSWAIKKERLNCLEGESR